MVKYVALNFVVFISTVFMGGCSTYETKDIYVPTGKNVPYVEYKSKNSQLNIGFVPDIRFGSIGVAGMPIIPVYIDTSETEEITLTVGLELSKYENFSFNKKPCATTGESKPICPYIAQVSAIAMYKDTLGRWNKIHNFYDLNNRILELLANKGGSRIVRQQIYDHYGYKEYPEWDILKIDVKYKFKCVEDCPKQLSIDTKDLVKIENVIIPEETILFSKTKEQSYDFTRQIQ